MSYRLEYLQEKDVALVWKLEQDVFAMPWRLEDYRDMVESSYRRCLCAFDGDRIIGECVLTMVAGEGDLSNVAVLDEYRRRGIAREMVKKILDDAAGEGIHAVTLEVRTSNLGAISLYRELGFQEEGIRPSFYESPIEDALIMWRREC